MRTNYKCSLKKNTLLAEFMAGKWHNTVVQVLRELCDEWVSKGLYKKVADGNSDPLPISYKKRPITINLICMPFIPKMTELTFSK